MEMTWIDKALAFALGALLVMIPLAVVVGSIRDLASGMRFYRVWWGKLFGFKAWHFINLDRKLRFKDGREVKEGETLSMTTEAPPILCMCGMHASISLMDAFGYAPGPCLCRVKVWGDLKMDDTKITGRHRKCLKICPDTRFMIIRSAVELLQIGRAVREEAPEEAKLIDVALSAETDPGKLQSYLDQPFYRFCCLTHTQRSPILLDDLNTMLHQLKDDQVSGFMGAVHHFLFSIECGTETFMNHFKKELDQYFKRAK